MRLPVVIGLLAVAGCNRIFGLDAVTVVDAPPDEAELQTVKLSFMISTTVGAMPGEISLDTSLANPQPAAGPMDGPLAEVTYDPALQVVQFPSALLGTKWRLQYTPDDNVPHELQWQPAADAHVVVPHVGPLRPTPPPLGSGYKIRPSGAAAPATFESGHLLTAGIWMDLGLTPNASNPAIIALAGTAPLSGPPGAPAEQDSAAFVDFGVVGPCKNANGYADLSLPAANGTIREVPPPTWITGTVPATILYPNNTALDNLRLPAALQNGRMGTSGSAKIVLGRGVDSELPAFTRQDLAITGQAEPAPVMLPLADCTFGTATTRFADPATFTSFPYVARARVTSTRTVAGVPLISSLVGVSTGRTPAGEITFDINTRGPIPNHPIVLGGTVLSAGDGVVLTPGTPTLALTFDLDAEHPADYFAVTVLRIESSALRALRVYLATDTTTTEAMVGGGVRSITTPIELDPLLFTRGTYVLAIQAHAGRPKAALGDFTAVDPAGQVVATVFTNTFVVD